MFNLRQCQHSDGAAKYCRRCLTNTLHVKTLFSCSAISCNKNFVIEFGNKRKRAKVEG